MRNSPSSGARYWLLVAVVLLGGVWLFARPGSVPLYDGPLNPDEPYRYVVPPSGYQQTRAPTVATGTVDVRNGVTQDTYIQSAESGPQIDVFFPHGSLRVPAGVNSVHVQARPVAPTAPLPSDGRIIGNVYRVSGQSPAGSVTVVTGTSDLPTIELRAPNGKQVGPVYEVNSGEGWRRAHVNRVGADVYATELTRFGDWALVQLGHYVGPGSRRTFVPGPSNSGGGPALPIGLGSAFGAVVVLILVVRFRRTRRPR